MAPAAGIGRARDRRVLVARGAPERESLRFVSAADLEHHTVASLGRGESHRAAGGPDRPGEAGTAAAAGERHRLAAFGQSARDPTVGRLIQPQDDGRLPLSNEASLALRFHRHARLRSLTRRRRWRVGRSRLRRGGIATVSIRGAPAAQDDQDHQRCKPTARRYVHVFRPHRLHVQELDRRSLGRYRARLKTYRAAAVARGGGGESGLVPDRGNLQLSARWLEVRPP